MGLLLGVDTGGTFTDAVLMRGEEAVVAKAKALTTRQDLGLGIGAAIRRVLEISGADPGEVALVSLSTTLATNALVEGRGAPAALVLIGFSERDIGRQGLESALRSDPVIRIAGGHDARGVEAAALDEAALVAGLGQVRGEVSAFAVAAQFATRAPAHELRARALIREHSGLPVTCSHELSPRLGGPRRALTALLNARLIGLVDALIAAAQALLAQEGISAPLMVVRGDGALISAELARERPIETILSGPAASLVGGRWLSGCADAVVSDIGGTTTDIAVLRGGRPAIDPEGAEVGGHRTMVEAVAMRTFGLGGDSEVHADPSDLSGGLRLGPRRLVPLALLAAEHPVAVWPALERQLAAERPGEHDGRFVLRLGEGVAGLEARDARVLARLGTTPVPLGEAISSRLDLAALERLVSRGLVLLSGLTPSDAVHVLGRAALWDSAAARAGATLFARRRDGRGEPIAPGPEALAQRVLDQLAAQSVDAVLRVAFEEDGIGPREAAAALVASPVTRAALARRGGVLARLSLGLGVPLIGLGASAACHYPAVGAALATDLVVPEHADVANAIGAVVGRVEMQAAITVTPLGEGRFRVHLADGARDFDTLEAALACAETAARAEARALAVRAGAEVADVAVTRDIRDAEAEGRRILVEAEVRARACGRARAAL